MNLFTLFFHAAFIALFLLSVRVKKTGLKRRNRRAQIIRKLTEISMDLKIFVVCALIFAISAQNDCEVRFRFAKKCVFYDANKCNLRILKGPGCEPIRTTRSEPRCPFYICRVHFKNLFIL
jgi:hypothetical protein